MASLKPIVFFVQSISMAQVQVKVFNVFIVELYCASTQSNGREGFGTATRIISLVA